MRQYDVCLRIIRILLPRGAGRAKQNALRQFFPASKSLATRDYVRVRYGNRQNRVFVIFLERPTARLVEGGAWERG